MINYTLKQLYSFEAVIRLSSYTHASKELNITQPAVYMQVQQLQENIGVKLFDLSGKKITPTFIGKKIYKTANAIIAITEASKLEIEHALNPDSGHLQIAVATTANSFISRLLSKFKQHYPTYTAAASGSARSATEARLSKRLSTAPWHASEGCCRFQKIIRFYFFKAALHCNST
jgi:DNA-binding transcriptional LysR family regulator